MRDKQKTFGEELKRLRRENNFSLRQLASKVIKKDGKPISPAYLNDIEKNNRIPSANIIEKIAKALNYNSDDLLLLGQRISPYTEKLLLEQPIVSGLLRKAQTVGFSDWQAVGEIIEGKTKKKRDEKNK